MFVLHSDTHTVIEYIFCECIFSKAISAFTVHALQNESYWTLNILNRVQCIERVRYMLRMANQNRKISHRVI